MSRSPLKLLLCAFAALLSLACVRDEESEAFGGRDCIRVLMDPSGIGDGGYNDLIYTGAVEIWYRYGGKFPVSIATPDDFQQAREIVLQWLREIDKENEGVHLIVFASSVYEPLCLEVAQRLDTQDVELLLFESDYSGELPVHCFSVSLYGASYASGALAREAGVLSPALIMANVFDAGIAEGAEGFRAGFAADSLECIYLSEQKGGGYDLSFEAYAACSSLVQSHDFLFPIAGGSNSGVYRFLRENPKGVFTAGMDSDKSLECSAVMMSVIKRMDLLVADVLRGWIEKGSLPDGEVYGLRSGYVQCVLSPNYDEWLEPYYGKCLEEATEKEDEYLSIL